MLGTVQHVFGSWHQHLNVDFRLEFISNNKTEKLRRNFRIFQECHFIIKYFSFMFRTVHDMNKRYN